MRKHATWVPLLLLSMAAAGCSSVAGLQITNPNYVIRDIRPHVSIALPLSASSIDFDFNIDVENPNRVGLRLDRIDFDLLANDSHVVSGTSTQGIRIPANGRGTVSLRTRVSYQELRGLFQDVADMVQGNRARYQLRGTAYYDTPLGQMQFPLTVYRTGN
jgi:hypothetical protein